VMTVMESLIQAMQNWIVHESAREVSI